MKKKIKTEKETYFLRTHKVIIKFVNDRFSKKERLPGICDSIANERDNLRVFNNSVFGHHLYLYD